MPENFSLTDLAPTHIISAEAILVITFVTCSEHVKHQLLLTNLQHNIPK